MELDFTPTHWITCGNRAAHNGEVGFHKSVNQVKACYGLVALCGWQSQGAWIEDFYEIIECDGIITENERGWSCSYGHEHVTAEVRYAEGWDYASDEQEAAQLRKYGVDAVAMNGGSI